MRWVNALSKCDDTSATGTACFPEDHFAVQDGFVVATALVECAAQTVAAAQGHHNRTGGPAGATNLGMLVAVSNFRIHTRPRAGEALTISVRQLKRLGPLLLIASTITGEGREIAAGQLTLYA
jgi:predicted hotdog family 3-hydroxylacyl-ACP dehydratase